MSARPLQGDRARSAEASSEPLRLAHGRPRRRAQGRRSERTAPLHGAAPAGLRRRRRARASRGGPADRAGGTRQPRARRVRARTCGSRSARRSCCSRTPGSPRITGRINALAVHPLGERLYAASANGGVWYSGDGGAHWRSLAGLAATATAGIVRPSHRNACHAIAVLFGGSEVERRGVGGHRRGEHARSTASPDTRSAASASCTPCIRPRPTSPTRGRSRPPTSPAAASTRSRSSRAATPCSRRRASASSSVRPRAALNAPWNLVQAPPFDSYRGQCSDVLWTAAVPGGAPARVWVWMMDGANPGLYCRDMGSPPAAAFVRVAFAPAPRPAPCTRRCAARSPPRRRRRRCGPCRTRDPTCRQTSSASPTPRPRRPPRRWW